MQKEKKVRFLLLLLVLVYITGISGFVIIEGYSFNEASYMTAITLSTVGFGEVKELSNRGRVFTTILIFSGVTLFLYCFSYITSFFIDGELKKYFKGAKMKKMINKLNDHIIICGGGTTSHKIIESFLKKDEKFIVIEKDENVIEQLNKEYGDKVLVIEGDATRDEVLLEGQIEKAKVLISVLPKDSQNLFIALSAKSLKKNVVVICKAIEFNSEAKLKKAGADYVISPSKIVAQRIANIASKTNVMDFLKFMTQNDMHDFAVELVEIPLNSKLINLSLREAQIPKLTGLNVIGIEEKGELKFNPLSTTIILGNSKLLVLGNSKQIERLIDIVKGD